MMFFVFWLFMFFCVFISYFFIHYYIIGIECFSHVWDLRGQDQGLGQMDPSLQQSHVRVTLRSVWVASRSHAGCLEVLSQVASRSLSFTAPHSYPKYEVWAIEFFCGRIPLTQARKHTFLLHF